MLNYPVLVCYSQSQSDQEYSTRFGFWKSLCQMFLIVVFLLMAWTVPLHATLIDRGGGLIYDDDLNITWLQDANYALTSGFHVNGLMNWIDANSWAGGMSYLDTVRGVTYTDWRLPTALNQNGSGPCSFANNCTGSEMGHLFFTELGNVNQFFGCTFFFNCGLVNTGPFTQIVNGWYWSSTPSDTLPITDGWGFSMGSGLQDAVRNNPGSTRMYAWAVRDGDVTVPVPEPSTLLLLASGLVSMLAFGKSSSAIKKKLIQ